MYLAPNPIVKNRTHSSDLYWSDRDWFKGWRNYLVLGSLNNEADMLYLLAEALRYVRMDKEELWIEDDPETFPGFVKSSGMPTNPREVYRMAAKEGSTHAALWCAYCLNLGIHGFPKDEQKASKTLAKISSPPETLVLPNLRFLAEMFDDIVREATRKELDESLMGESDYDGEPTSCFLEYRYIELAKLMLYLGLPFVTEKPYQSLDSSKWPSCFDLLSYTILDEKRSWTNWCRAQGLDVRLN